MRAPPVATLVISAAVVCLPVASGGIPDLWQWIWGSFGNGCTTEGGSCSFGCASFSDLYVNAQAAKLVFVDGRWEWRGVQIEEAKARCADGVEAKCTGNGQCTGYTKSGTATGGSCSIRLAEAADRVSLGCGTHTTRGGPMHATCGIVTSKEGEYGLDYGEPLVTDACVALVTYFEITP